VYYSIIRYDTIKKKQKKNLHQNQTALRLCCTVNRKYAIYDIRHYYCRLRYNNSAGNEEHENGTITDWYWNEMVGTNESIYRIALID